MTSQYKVDRHQHCLSRTLNLLYDLLNPKVQPIIGCEQPQYFCYIYGVTKSTTSTKASHTWLSKTFYIIIITLNTSSKGRMGHWLWKAGPVIKQWKNSQRKWQLMTEWYKFNLYSKYFKVVTLIVRTKAFKLPLSLVWNGILPLLIIPSNSICIKRVRKK